MYDILSKNFMFFNISENILIGESIIISDTNHKKVSIKQKDSV